MLKSKFFLPVLSGILLSLAWPANGFPYLIFIAFVPLFFLLDELKSAQKPLRKVFGYSYLAMFIWNALTTWWIWNSTEFGAIMAILLNSFFMSLVWVVFSLSQRYFYNRAAIFLFPVYWVAFEFLHLDWDLSWSWLNLGNVFANHPYAIQWYEFTGTLGGSWWIITINILAFRWIKQLLEEKYPLVQHFIYSLPLLIMILLPIGYSTVIYQNYKEKGDLVEVVVVQPNMDPWSEQFSSPPQEVIDRMINLSKPLISQETMFWVAPESAIQEGLQEPGMTVNGIRRGVSTTRLQNFMAEYPQLQLIIGASTYQFLKKETPTSRTTENGGIYDEYNTAILMNAQGFEDTYHKSKLVPGPEKMPFKKLLAPLQEVAFDLGGTVGSLGYDEERKIFYSANGEIGVAPLICYESIYGGFVAEFVRNRAQLLMIITNDGWWGNTAGHKQHLAYARLRAIECRRSIARSANTGISGFINQRGDLIESTSYWVQDARKAQLAANKEITLFVRYGDYPGRLSVFLGIMFLLINVTVYLKKDKKDAPA